MRARAGEGGSFGGGARPLSGAQRGSGSRRGAGAAMNAAYAYKQVAIFIGDRSLQHDTA